jgi:hypothetical protein
LVLLGWFGYQEGSGVAQTEGAKQGIWILYTVFPVIGIAVQAAILASLYKLRDKDVAVMGKANSGGMPMDEAEAILGGRFPRRLAGGVPAGR